MKLHPKYIEKGRGDNIFAKYRYTHWYQNCISLLDKG